MAVSIKEFREAYESGKLIGVVCENCGHRRTTHAVFCLKCGSNKLTKVELATHGKIKSYTVQSVPPEEFVNDIPYAYVLVQLDDGASIAGWMPYVKEGKSIKVGDRVKYTKSYKNGIVFVKEEEKIEEPSPTTEMVYY